MFIAATLANTLDESVSMNGEPSRTDMGIWQVVLVKMAESIPLQSAKDG